MLTGARKGTRNSHFCAVCLSLLDGTQSTKVTNRTRHRGRSLSSATSGVGFTFSFSKPSLQCLIWRFGVRDIDIYVWQNRDAMHTGRANGEEQGEEKRDNKAGSGGGGMLNAPLKLRTRLEREEH